MTKLLTFSLSLFIFQLNAQDFSMVKELILEEEVLEAKSEVQKILSDHPENAEALYWLGSILSQEFSANSLNPEKDIKLMIDAGVSFEKSKFFDFNCLMVTDKGRQLKSYASKSYNLGISAYQAGDIEMALTHFKMVVMADDWAGEPDHESLYYTGHCASKLSDNFSAKAFLEKAMILKPEDVKVTKELLKVKVDLGELDEAKALIKQTLTFHPNEKTLWHELMSVNLRLNNNEEALSAAQTLSHLDSKNSETKVYLASLYDKTGNSQKAIETYVECVTINPEHPKASYNLGVLLYNEAVKIHNMNPTVEQKEDERKKLEMAKSHLNRAKKIDPSNTEIDQILRNIDKLN